MASFAKRKLVQLVIGVTQPALLNMHHLPYGRSRSQRLPKVKLVVQRDVSAKGVVPVELDEGARDVLFTGLEVSHLPGPPGAVEVGMVDVKEGVGGYRLVSS